jgi:hypothetical protein
VLTVLRCCSSRRSASAAERPLDEARRPSGRCASRRRCSRRGCRCGSTRFLPALMRKHGIDLWVVPMREYKRGPGLLVDHRARDVCRAAAHDLRVRRHLSQLRRRTVADLRETGSRWAARPRAACSKRGGPPRPRPANIGRGSRRSCGATSSGSPQVRRRGAHARASFGINRSTVFAFSDGLVQRRAAPAWSAALGAAWTAKFKDAEGLRSS